MLRVRYRSNVMTSLERRKTKMILPNPDVLDQLIQDRQRGLRTAAVRATEPAERGVRVRVGHALIAAGAALSGECVELAGRPALSRAA